MELLTIQEQIIMKQIWAKEGDISLKELIESVPYDYEKGDHYNRNTIATFVRRLKRKGYVTTYHQKRECYIHPLHSIEAIIEYQIRFFADLRFDGDVGKVKSIVNSISE